MPRTKASAGASTQLPAAVVRAPASAYSSTSKARVAASSTVTSNPTSTSRRTSAGTTGARRSVSRASARIHRRVGCMPGLFAGRGSADPLTLADHRHAAVADGEAAAAVVVVVDPDQAAVRHHDVLVDDRVAHDCAPPDLHVVEQDRAL